MPDTTDTPISQEAARAMLAALQGVVHCLAWHVENQGRGVAMDAEFLRRARAAIALAEAQPDAALASDFVTWAEGGE
jgi:hypothetical protein